MPARVLIQSIGIFAAPYKPSARLLAEQLVSLCEKHGLEARLQQDCALQLSRPELGRGDHEIAAADVLVTLSGDGGVLTAARLAAPHGTPILAVDLGRLGFLSAVRPPELEAAFHMLRAGEFVTEERLMLEAQVLRPVAEEGSDSDPIPLADGNYTVAACDVGLNDAVVAKSALARILPLSISVAGDLVAEMRSDGLIISTPTGSTAYALSSGGPIVHPDVPLLLICPICAHSLSQRPLVVDPGETIELRMHVQAEEVSPAEMTAMLTIDGQVGIPLQSHDVVRVRKAECTTKLLRPPQDSFYSRLRRKMGWGG